jgi:8-oxo-dGTP pyrophosphatase MutT (NUDIX family)
MIGKLLHGIAVHLRAMLLCPADVGVAAVVEQAGRIVLVRHTYRKGWYFPGGGLKRGEPPAFGIIRELQEEIGLAQSAPPQLLGVYVRRRLWATQLVVLYRVRDAVFVFRPNLEIKAVTLADPSDPPPGTGNAVRQRLKELYGEAPVSPLWRGTSEGCN